MHDNAASLSRLRLLPTFQFALSGWISRAREEFVSSGALMGGGCASTSVPSSCAISSGFVAAGGVDDLDSDSLFLACLLRTVHR